VASYSVLLAMMLVFVLRNDVLSRPTEEVVAPLASEFAL